MFGILVVEEVPARSWWDRLKLHLSRAYSVKQSSGNVRMAVFCTMRVRLPAGCGKRLRDRRLRAAVQALRRLGARKAIYPPEAREWAEQAGLPPIGLRSVLQACAAQAALAALAAYGARPQDACVTLWASREGFDVQHTAIELARRVKYVGLVCRRQSGALAVRLYEEYGMALRKSPLAQEGEAALHLIFDPPEQEPQGLRLNLTGGDLPFSCEMLEMSGPPALMDKRPEGCPSSSFAAALVLCGGVTPGEIEMKIVEETSLT